jgi:co-chaperonin GroES (HSP10)
MKQEEEKTPTVLEEINALELDEGFTPIMGLPIPFRDMVVVLPVMQGDKKTASGIILPGNSDAANDRKIGIVVRYGPGINLNDTPIRIGMKVFFESKGNYYMINGTDGNVYLFMHQHMIYGAVTPDTYFIPNWKDKDQKRRESRIEGLKNVAKKEEAKLAEEGVEIKSTNSQ